MQRADPRAHAEEHVEPLAGRQRWQGPREGRTRDVLHVDEQVIAVEERIVDPTHVVVLDLAAEADLPHGRALEQDELEGDDAVDLDIDRLEHRALAAGAEPVLEPVSIEQELACLEVILEDIEERRIDAARPPRAPHELREPCVEPAGRAGVQVLALIFRERLAIDDRPPGRLAQRRHEVSPYGARRARGSRGAAPSSSGRSACGPRRR